MGLLDDLLGKTKEAVSGSGVVGNAIGLDKDTAGLLGMAVMNATGNGGMSKRMMAMEMLNQPSQQEASPSYLEQNYLPQASSYLAPGMTDEIQRIASAIGKFESGGKYDALGPLTKGDRAYGKYQVMGNNIPSWSKEVLGYSVTPEQFRANPQLQDQIAHTKMSQYYDKYGNVNDVASMWFSGRPHQGNTSKDVLGTSVPQYIAAVNRYYQGK